MAAALCFMQTGQQIVGSPVMTGCTIFIDHRTKVMCPRAGSTRIAFGHYPDWAGSGVGTVIVIAIVVVPVPVALIAMFLIVRLGPIRLERRGARGVSLALGRLIGTQVSLLG